MTPMLPYTARTAPALAWCAAGSPAATWVAEPIAIVACACCGMAATTSVPISAFVAETYSQPSDFLAFGDRVCPACAWWHSETKQRHRGWLVAGNQLWWPLISVETATEFADPARPSWRDLLRDVAALPPDTPVAGLLTADPKPRLWPRVRAGTVARGGLYVHSTGDKSPVGDLSATLALDFAVVARLIDALVPLLAHGFTKRALWRGLVTDYARSTRDLAGTLRADRALAPERTRPEFAVAVLVAGLTKAELVIAGEDKHG